MASHRTARAAFAMKAQNAVDVVVVGAGVVGLAIARRLSASGLSVVIIEQEAAIGTATSARNSEVIHAGIYYQDTPLKAQLCTAGRPALYEYCAARHVPHRRIGKLIVAATAQDLPILDRIQENAIDAGVDDLMLLSGDDSRRLEPALQCVAALLSPSTGIIDSHSYMMALLSDAEAYGALLALNTKVTSLSQHDDEHWSVHITGESDPVIFAERVVITAGHGSQALAAETEGLLKNTIPLQHYARGHYFAYHGRHPFTHLIYPVPVPGGLGTHLTLDLAGRARFGPDVEWIDGVDYAFGANRGDAFEAAARRIWPGLDPARLSPDYCGIRPKLSGPGDSTADFAIHGRDHHGLNNLVALYGIESPGLTASLAIADLVANKFDLDKL